MGVIYFLANHDARTLFELGKGHELAQTIAASLAADPGELERAIAEATKAWKDSGPDYARELAAKLIAFAGTSPGTRLELVRDDDCSLDRFIDERWPTVGTRYDED